MLNKFLITLEGKTDLNSLKMKHKTLKYIQKLDDDEFDHELSLIEEEKKLPDSERNSIEDEYYQFEDKYDNKYDHDIQTHGMGDASTYHEKTSKARVYKSNKSESSFDSKMGDTPSNYNIPNGRVKVIEKPIPGKFESESKEKFMQTFGKPQLNSNLSTKRKFNQKEKNAQTQLPSALDTINGIDLEYEETKTKDNMYGRSISSINDGKVVDFNLPMYHQHMNSTPHLEGPQMNQTFGNRSRSLAKLVPESVLGTNDDSIPKPLDVNIPSASFQKGQKTKLRKKKRKLIQNKSENLISDPNQNVILKTDKNLKITNVNDLESAYN